MDLHLEDTTMSQFTDLATLASTLGKYDQILGSTTGTYIQYWVQPDPAQAPVVDTEGNPMRDSSGEILMMDLPWIMGHTETLDAAFQRLQLGAYAPVTE